ncbi:MAG: hypothetical protein RLZZ241_463 [Bacteroidota bacterium]|jgi:hypothetical protein
MNYSRFATLLLIFIVASCNSSSDPYGIAPNRVGKLQRTTRLNQLDSIYALDSLVRDSSLISMGLNSSIQVFEKGGKLLLTLSPASDTLNRIGNIRIQDPRFTTEKGISIESTFGEVASKYEIQKVITSFKNLVLILKDTDVYVTISREDLPGDLRFSSAAIEAVQIPETTPIRYLMVAWD